MKLPLACFLALSSTVLADPSPTESAAAPTADQTAPDRDPVTGEPVRLGTVNVRGQRDAYADNPVVREGRVGVLGDRDVFDTPFNVTHFSEEAIEDAQAVKISDLIGDDPSVRVANTSASYYEDFIIRGFRVTGDSTTYDGLAIHPPYGPNLLPALERVDIIKGANTLLGGVTQGLNLGGTVNLVPKRAKDTPITSLTASYLSDSRFGGQADIGRRFGKDNAFGVRVNVYGQEGDTAFDGEHERLKLYTAALDYRGERFRAFLDFGRSEQNSKGVSSGLFPGANLGTHVPEPPASGSNFSQPFAFSDVATRYYIGRTEYDVAKDVTVYAAYAASQDRYRQLLSYASLDDQQGNITEMFQNGSGKDNNVTIEGGLRAKFDTGWLSHQVNVSAVRARQKNNHFYIFDPDPRNQPQDASNIYHPVRVQAQPLYFQDDNLDQAYGSKQSSVALTDFISILKDRLQFLVAARHQRIQGGDGTTYDDGQDQSAWTPAFAILGKPVGKLSLYFNYIESLEGGPTAPDNAVNKGQIFKPTHDRQYEAGAKYDFGAIGVSADYYRISQPVGILDQQTRFFTVAGRQRNQGVELNVFGKVVEGLRLNGGVAYTDARLVKTDGGVNEGHFALGVPRTNLSLSGDYDLPFLRGLTLNAGVLRTSAMVIDLANTTKLDAFTTVDVGARYKTRLFGVNTTWRAAVTNLADDNYWVADVYGGFYLSTARTVLLSTTVDF